MLTTIGTTTAGTSLTLIAVLALLVLLIQKEIFSSMRGEHVQRVVRALNIAIVPLAMVFIISCAYAIFDTLTR